MTVLVSVNTLVFTLQFRVFCLVYKSFMFVQDSYYSTISYCILDHMWFYCSRQRLEITLGRDDASGYEPGSRRRLGDHSGRENCLLPFEFALIITWFSLSVHTATNSAADLRRFPEKPKSPIRGPSDRRTAHRRIDNAHAKIAEATDGNYPRGIFFDCRLEFRFFGRHYESLVVHDLFILCRNNDIK